jgi:hypothetical protein
MKVVRRNHPRGEAGTRISCEEAAKRAAEGRLDPRTRAWAIEKIVQAGNPRGTLQRAEVILNALRRERIYIPDPTDAEFIPSAACTLKGCDGLMFLGEDCDGLLVSFLAAVGSIGIEGAVVGHGYEDDGQLSHVLAAVFDGKSWHLADPSTDHPFGHVDRPKRERWIGVPGVNVLCDSLNGTCDPAGIGSGISGSRMRPHGDFVGVGAPMSPRGQVGSPMPSYGVGSVGSAVMSGFVGKAEAIGEPWVLETAREQAAKLREALYKIRFGHARLSVLRSQYMDRPIADVDVSPPETGAWKLADEDYYQSLLSFAGKALEYADQAGYGNRPAGWDPDSKQVVIGGHEGEPVLEMDKLGNMTIKDLPGKTDAVVPTVYGSGQVGITLLAAGVIAVIVVGVYATVKTVCDTIDKKTDAAVQTDLGVIHQNMLKEGYSLEQANESVKAISGSIAEKAAALAKLEAEKNKGTGEITEMVKTVVLGTAGVALIGVLAYGLITFTPEIKRSLAERRRDKALQRELEDIEAAGEVVAIEAA